MARDSIAMNAVTNSNITPQSAELTVTTVSAGNVTNGIKIAEFFKYQEPVLVLENTHSAPIVVTLVAGDADSGAINSGAGDKDITLTNGKIYHIGRIEADRFMQANGDLYIDNVTAAGTKLKLHAIGKKVGL